jgi:periplasmic protein TonB
MSHFSSSKTTDNPRRSAVIIAFLLLSVLAHLALLHYLPQPKPTTTSPAPAPFELVEYPSTPPVPLSDDPQPDYEIDQVPILPEPEEPVESHRRAEHDQLVEQEQAPIGDDVRDQEVTLPVDEQPVAEPAPVIPPAPPQPVPVPEPPTRPRPEQPKQPEPIVEGERLDRPEITEHPETDIGQEERETPPLTREQLFPSTDTMRRIVEGQAADRERIKEREDVEIGDTVWLNLQHDRLVSFFRRFHGRVERVWNYPVEATQQGIEGTLELLIIVSKEGELIDVDLKQTSGSDILDFEAIQAVYRAAPFGPLGRHYPHDELRIRAHFSYRISGRYIFGR